MKINRNDTTPYKMDKYLDMAAPLFSGICNEISCVRKSCIVTAASELIAEATVLKHHFIYTGSWVMYRVNQVTVSTHKHSRHDFLSRLLLMLIYFFQPNCFSGGGSIIFFSIQLTFRCSIMQT